MTEHNASPAGAPVPATEHKNYFLDQEFIEDGRTIQLIQIGLVCDDGREYEAISSEYDYDSASDWVKKNVILPLFHKAVDKGINGNWMTQEKPIDASNFHKEYGVPLSHIAKQVAAFIGVEKPIEEGKRPGLRPGNKVRFYGYYADYDWVLFCSLFGRMIDLPEGLPMYCRDLKQDLDRMAENVYPEVSTKEAIERLKTWEGWPVQKSGEEHDALNDARWNRALFDFMVNIHFLNQEKKRPEFQDALAQLINSYSLESHSDTPDFILATYVATALSAYSRAVQDRDRWFNIKPWDGKREKIANVSGRIHLNTDALSELPVEEAARLMDQVGYEMAYKLSPEEWQLIQDVRKHKASPLNQVPYTPDVFDREKIDEQLQKVKENSRGLPWLSYEEMKEEVGEALFGGTDKGSRFLVLPGNQQQRWYMSRPTPLYHPEQKVSIPVKEGDHDDSFIRKEKVNGYTVKALKWSDTPGWSWVYLLEFVLQEEPHVTYKRWVPEQRLRGHAPVGVMEQLPDDVQQKINNKSGAGRVEYPAMPDEAFPGKVEDYEAVRPKDTGVPPDGLVTGTPGEDLGDMNRIYENPEKKPRAWDFLPSAAQPVTEAEKLAYKARIEKEKQDPPY